MKILVRTLRSRDGNIKQQETSSNNIAEFQQMFDKFFQAGLFRGYDIVNLDTHELYIHKGVDF